MAQQLSEAVQRLHFNTPSPLMRAKASARIERNEKKVHQAGLPQSHGAHARLGV